MLQRLHSRWLAGAGAVLLVLAMTGVAAAASLVTDTTPVASDPTEPAVSATLATFEDVNGDGIDDDCQTGVVADATAVTEVMAAVDSNADGTISVSEAAHSDWVGGPNCNHGGYVSGVAGASADDCDATETPTAETDDSNVDATDQDKDEGPKADAVTSTVVATDPACTEDPETPDAEAPDDAPAAVCVATPVVVPPVVDPTVEVAPNAHGLAVSTIAQSDAVGGKHCNHGGAVSAAAHADKAARAAKADKADKATHVRKIHAAKTHGKPQVGQS